MERQTWCPTPASASAARRLRPDVSKNSSTALSSKEGEVDHRLRARHRLREALAGDGVHARAGRGGDDLVAGLAQDRRGLGADQAGAADDDDLHGAPLFLKRTRCPGAGRATAVAPLRTR